MTTEVIGQKKLKERCKAIMSSEDNFNLLLRGPWGYGKTTLAVFLAMLIGLFVFMLGSNINLSPGMTNVVDEAHLISEYELLYKPMEEHRIIFTTNMASRLPEPFLSRCHTFRMEPYTVGELAKIVSLHTGISEQSSGTIARRCKGNPRIGVKLGEEVTSLARYRGLEVDRAVGTILEYIGVDERGLDKIDREYLSVLRGGPVSARTLRAGLMLDKKELRRRESYLIRSGYIRITGKGRILCGRHI